jgi:hypothetical protein
VTVHYTGWTKDGKMFDSSVVRGEPSTFPLTNVIKGWTEGVQLMVEGDKVRFWIPADLAYGEPTPAGAPSRQLTFDVELISAGINVGSSCRASGSPERGRHQLVNPATEEPLARASTNGLDMRQLLAFARRGRSALRKLSSPSAARCSAQARRHAARDELIGIMIAAAALPQ